MLRNVIVQSWRIELLANKTGFEMLEEIFLWHFRALLLKQKKYLGQLKIGSAGDSCLGLVLNQGPAFFTQNGIL